MCEKESVKILTNVANEMLKGKKMPETLRKSDLLPVYKGKGNVRSCEFTEVYNYWSMI